MTGRRPSKFGNFFVAIRLVGLVGVVVIVLLSLGVLWVEWGRELSVQQIEDTILSWGMWGVVGAMGLMVLHSFVPFPAELLAIANGMLYGPVWGTAITWSGAMLGAWAAFGLTRLFGRPFVAHLVARHNRQDLDDWATVQGAQLFFLSRFMPIIAFNVINYAAGLTRISWWTFTWTTGFGILPLTALMVYMGDNIRALSWYHWVMLLTIGLLLCVVLRRRVHLLPDRGAGET